MKRAGRADPIRITRKDDRMIYRYFPYEGNDYHELRIAPGAAPGDVEMTVLKDRGSRNESIVIKSADLEEVITRIRAASAQDAGAPVTPAAPFANVPRLTRAGNCPTCSHLWRLHGPDGCTGKVYPAHSLTGEPCLCEQSPAPAGNLP